MINSIFAQDAIKQYIKSSAKAIATKSTTKDYIEKLPDLSSAIGSAKIVMLGEQDHGDGATYLAKTRIVKYLHDQLGFSVLVFEDDFFSINQGWEELQNQHMSYESFLKTISITWRGCDGSGEFLTKYIAAHRNSTRPLALAGMDNTMHTPHLLTSIDSLVRKMNLEVTWDSVSYKLKMNQISSWYKYIDDPVSTKAIDASLREIKEQLAAKIGANDFWVYCLDNFVSLIHQYANRKINLWKFRNIRDHQMARNLRWLSEIKYPGQKIIVWSHNYHVSKNSGNYPQTFLNEGRSMASYFINDTTLQNVYSIGFTSRSGWAGRIMEKKHQLPKHRSNSLEMWVEDSITEGFVDFKPFNLLNKQYKEPFYMAGGIIGGNENERQPYHKDHYASWNLIFDGIYYIKEMFPCPVGDNKK
ncbi:MAG: erythromycin esterase family protein [Chitinophagaceae bacterium]